MQPVVRIRGTLLFTRVQEERPTTWKTNHVRDEVAWSPSRPPDLPNCSLRAIVTLCRVALLYAAMATEALLTRVLCSTQRQPFSFHPAAPLVCALPLGAPDLAPGRPYSIAETETDVPSRKPRSKMCLIAMRTMPGSDSTPSKVCVFPDPVPPMANTERFNGPASWARRSVCERKHPATVQRQGRQRRRGPTIDVAEKRFGRFLIGVDNVVSIVSGSVLLLLSAHHREHSPNRKSASPIRNRQLTSALSTTLFTGPPLPFTDMSRLGNCTRFREYALEAPGAVWPLGLGLDLVISLDLLPPVPIDAA